MMMSKRSVVSALVVLGALGASPAFAQLELPAPSPAAKVMQRVGLTEITVEYSSPGVKGRKIWGELVPFGKPWRSGANAATKITFSRDATFGGKPVPAGTYAIVSHPTQGGWSVALNKDLTLFASPAQYDEKKDVVRASATTAEIPHRERMTFIFSNTTEAGTSLDLEWEKLRVSVPITVDTAAQVQANIKSSLDGLWRAPAQAARYVAETSKDYDTALKYADQSIAIKSTWFNTWVKADILAQKGKYPEARKLAQAAYDMGMKDEQNFFFKDQISKALADWKNKK